MASSYTVRADVVDASTHPARSGETFLVDTNVWFWMCYEAAPDAPGVAKPRQAQSYPAFLDRVMKAGGNLRWSALSWSELGHIIERTEFEIAKACGATQANGIKQYRYENADERSRVVAVIQATWNQVTALASTLGDTVIDEVAVHAANEELNAVTLDGYDLFLAQTLRKAGITGVITDDGDFCTVSGITVFTTNRNVLRAAQAQGRLRTV
jgi:predicted nucleic acid-binding protein